MTIDPILKTFSFYKALTFLLMLYLHFSAKANSDFPFPSNDINDQDICFVSFPTNKTNNKTTSISDKAALPTPQSVTVTSSDGRFRLTNASDVSTIPSGGGVVNYTYTIENISSQRQYYVSGNDDRCSPISGGTGLNVQSSLLGPTVYYINAGQTVTWTCSQYISQTTTNTACFEFADDYSSLLLSFSWQGISSACASLTVTRDIPTGTPGCNVLWYSGDETGSYDGTIGTVDPLGNQTVLFDIESQTGVSTLEGSPAMAVDPNDPSRVYYVPRGEVVSGNPSIGGLYRYSTTSTTSTLVSSSAATPYVVRLGIDNNGLVWAVDADGRSWSFDSATNNWTDRGIILLPSGFDWLSLGSGDITFDGNNTMYIVASSSGTGQLFTVTMAELLDGTPSSAHVGTMGTGAQFNGIAFTENGQLWATSSSSGTSYLYSVDIPTGAATQVSILAQSAMDLGSCALPQAVIDLEKTASTSSSASNSVHPGDTITYTMNACNVGTLVSSNTILLDTIPVNTTYVAGSTTMNGISIPDVSGQMPFRSGTLINSTSAGIGRISPGLCSELEFKVLVNTGFIATEICNQAFLTYTGGPTVISDDPTVPGGNDPTCTPVVFIDIAKTAPITTISTPQNVTYTYLVNNLGTEPLINVNVVDDRCASVNYISGDLNADGRLQNTETWIYDCTAMINGNTTNIATANGTGEFSADFTSDQDIWTINVEASIPTLDINKTSSPTTLLYEGDTITYNIEVTNTGSVDALNVTINDVLPPGVSYLTGTAMKTYPDQIVAQTGSTTKTFSGATLNAFTTVPLNMSTSDGIPVGAQITSIDYFVNGRARSAILQGSGIQENVSLTVSTPNGFTSDVDRGSDTDNEEFGTSNTGNWNTVTRTSVNASGNAIGNYSFDFYDSSNASVNPDHDNISGSITTHWSYIPPRPPVTNAANAPNMMVTTADGITLQAGETMSVQLQARVNLSTLGTIVNTATANGDNVFQPVIDSALNIVINVCTDPAGVDTDGDNINDICDLDDDNDGIPDAIECQEVFLGVDFEVTDPAGSTPSDFYISDFDFSGFSQVSPIRSPDYITGANALPGSQWFFPSQGGDFLALQGSTNNNSFTNRLQPANENDGVFIVFDAATLSSNGIGIGEMITLSFSYAPGHNYDSGDRNADDDTALRVWITDSASANALPTPSTPGSPVTFPPDFEIQTGAWNPVDLTSNPNVMTNQWKFASFDFIYNGGELRIAVLATSGPIDSGDEVAYMDDLKLSICNDTDNDGVDDYLDLDSDNDGIFDLYEAGHHFPDTNNNGIIDGSANLFGINGLYDSLEVIVDNGILNYPISNSEPTPDGTYDAYELDSDGDGCFDALEESVIDGDLDGIAGTGIPSVHPNGLVTTHTYIPPPNNFWQNPLIGFCLPEICNDGIDNDGDGQTDIADPNCCPPRFINATVTRF